LTSGPVQHRTKSVFREYFEAITIALAVALFLRFFVVEAFKIPSGSMVDTLEIGDFIFVNKLAYRTEIPFTALSVPVPLGGTTLKEWRQPERGDIIVFRWPVDPHIDYIKRVVGVPGDVIEMRGDALFVNGKKHRREYVESYGYLGQDCRPRTVKRFAESDGENEYSILQERRAGLFRNFGPIQVEPGHLFMMGDNRDNSSDSRAWGQVPIHNVKGRALFVWLSLNRCGSLSERVRWSRFGQAVR